MAQFKVTISDADGNVLSGINGNEGESLDDVVAEARKPVTERIMSREAQGLPHGIAKPLSVNWEKLDS